MPRVQNWENGRWEELGRGEIEKVSMEVFVGGSQIGLEISYFTIHQHQIYICKYTTYNAIILENDRQSRRLGMRIQTRSL